MRAPILPRLLSGRQRSASPAASDMSEALRPDARPYLYLMALPYSLILLRPVVLQGSGSRGPGSASRLTEWRMVV
jgi:hypothetical protein